LPRDTAAPGAGLVAGALFPRERWRRVRLPARVTVAPNLRGGDGWVVAVAR